MSAFDLRKSLARRTLAALAAITASACGGAAPAASAPDLTGLLDAYAAPRGTVDMQQRPPWLESAKTQLDVVDNGDSAAVLSKLTHAASREIDAATLPDSHNGAIPTRADGLLTIDIACGDDPDQTATVAMQVVDGTIVPVLWGTARRCRFGAGPGLATFDGSFAIYRYPTKEQLVRVDGVISNGAPSRITLDFRSAGGALETRITTASGDVIVARKGSQIVARAANGRFRCNVSERACTAMPK